MDNYPTQKQQHLQKSLQLHSQSNLKDQFLGKVLFQKYLLTKKLGEGSFGRIYKATTKTDSFAFKIEKKRIHHSLLENEANIMSKLQGLGRNKSTLIYFIIL
jgi:predicted Ser/Thr protein kinase